VLIAVSNGGGNIRRVEAALKPPAGFASTCAVLQVAGIETGLKPSCLARFQ
jgi:hypothetical protein